jgi:hypothetical protein
MAVEPAASVDKPDEKQEYQNGFNDAGPLHGRFSSSLFNAQDPQYERDEDEKILGQVFDLFLFAYKIPDQ